MLPRRAARLARVRRLAHKSAESFRFGAKPRSGARQMPSADTLLILAAGLQAGLTFFAIVRMASSRIVVLKARDVALADVALDTRNYPERVHKLQNNVTNQFETPLLFFAAVAVALGAGVGTYLLAALAYLWLATRVVHMAIHTGSNDVVKRFRAFTAGLATLAAMWLVVIAAALAG